jgi:hypothetical protein
MLSISSCNSCSYSNKKSKKTENNLANYKNLKCSKPKKNPKKEKRKTETKTIAIIDYNSVSDLKIEISRSYTTIILLGRVKSENLYDAFGEISESIYESKKLGIKKSIEDKNTQLNQTTIHNGAATVVCTYIIDENNQIHKDADIKLIINEIPLSRLNFEEESKILLIVPKGLEDIDKDRFIEKICQEVNGKYKYFDIAIMH